MWVYLYPSGTETELKNAYIGEYGWQPWANTVAYRPLNSTTTVNDQSWNNRNLTNYNNVAFGTYAGVNCAYFNGSSQYLNQDSVNMWLFNWNMTVNFYMKSNGVNNQVVLCNWFWKPYTWFYILYNNWLQVHSGSWTPPINTLQSWWNMVTCTNDSSTLKVYINWVLTETRGLAVSTSTSTKLYLWAIWNDVDWLRAYFNGYISEVILEKTIRTSDYIINYYNLTKANYWL